MTDRAPLRLAALAIAVTGAVMAACLTPHAPPDGDPALIMLLRFMAVLKALGAAAAASLAAWRFRQPIPAPLAYGYVTATALVAASPVLIWNISHILAGAILFHAGLLLFAALAWADGRSWNFVPARLRARATHTANLNTASG